ncbi:hypothetical protein [Photobacterium sp. 1_MG-2023]|uniref:hypothetical protein n=1 Tax=Photobacterium sp. 1_MG-2023 TaxID=3062646 RepID=UPI0026E3262B|nr:hypothetical protein [Photobacterium sp. 1_MG-2023]MDO6709063.1 hypothetical protein [Photobacterium sp. 1_MG-2023]
MEKIIFKFILFSSLLSPYVYAEKRFSFDCQIDYTQDIVSEQGQYIRLAPYQTNYDFQELGITVAPKNHPEYPENYLIINEPLVRNYHIEVEGDNFILKSNDKVLINTSLKKSSEGIVINASIQEFSEYYVLIDFSFYNPNSMLRQHDWQIIFADVDNGINNDNVMRAMDFEHSYGGYECLNDLEETNFEAYQKYWGTLLEAILQKKVEITTENPY